MAGALLVVSGVNLVSLSVGVQVMNALLLPIVLGFLYLLARRLPEPHRLKGGLRRRGRDRHRDLGRIRGLFRNFRIVGLKPNGR